MAKQDKDCEVHKQKRESFEKGNAQQDVARARGQARAWDPVNRLAGGHKRFDARRNVPSGPLGGSGRKTNQSRSS